MNDLAFQSAIAWRKYAATLEDRIITSGQSQPRIASDETRTDPPVAFVSLGTEPRVNIFAMDTREANAYMDAQASVIAGLESRNASLHRELTSVIAGMQVERAPIVTMQMLINCGLNAFAFELVSESLVGKGMDKRHNMKPLRFEFRGVVYTLESAPAPESDGGEAAK